MIKNLVVLGAGTMAMGVAIEAAMYDYTVHVWYHRDASGPRNKLDKILNKSLASGNMDQRELERVKSNIIISNSLDVCSQADLVIESIAEDYIQKVQLFQNVSDIVKETAIICSNTSSLSINDLAKMLPYKNTFVGLHFFNPVSKMKLVEIIQGRETSFETIEVLKEFVKSLNKEYVLVKDSPGFIVNRLLLSYLNNAANLFSMEAASMEDIDKSMRFGANHPVGPFALCDIIGIDVVHAALTSLYQQLQDEAYRPNPIFEKLLGEGKLGRKAGEGFYRYIR